MEFVLAENSAHIRSTDSMHPSFPSSSLEQPAEDKRKWPLVPFSTMIKNKKKHDEVVKEDFRRLKQAE